LKIRTRIYAIDSGISTIVLDDSDSLSIRRSLRLSKGDCVCCFNGDGKNYIYSISESTSKQVILHLDSIQDNSADSFPDTNVFIASTKGKTKDRIVRDITPLGVSTIYFYQADRSIAKPSQDSFDRLLKITIEACRQCGRSTIPEVLLHDKPIIDLYNDREISACNTIIFLEGAVDSNVQIKECSDDSMNIVFGPEGGFSPQEKELFKQKGFPTASLGPRILRSELAVVVGLTVIQQQRGLLSS
jgi:16S rRNA (uracil1498-N3)-methyltransferase